MEPVSPCRVGSEGNERVLSGGCHPVRPMLHSTYTQPTPFHPSVSLYPSLLGPHAFVPTGSHSSVPLPFDSGGDGPVRRGRGPSLSLLQGACQHGGPSACARWEFAGAPPEAGASASKRDQKGRHGDGFGRHPSFLGPFGHDEPPKIRFFGL